MTDEQNETSAPASPVSSSQSGTARDVIQARDIHGGVHLHPTSQPAHLPHQLPGDVPGFVNRDHELEHLHSLADQTDHAGNVIVVAGTAGAGKTALAVRLAHRLRTRFPDGQLFVNLHGYDSGPPLGPHTVLDRFLRAFAIPPPAVPVDLEERAELYRSLLAGHHVLIVLDNAATTAQVRPLLPGEPGCLVLITSRNRLSGLAARNGAHRLTLGLLPHAHALDLVTSTMTGYRTGDAPDQLAELVQLCARLPLALRIAAERAAARPWMPLHQLITDLRNESALWDALSTDDGEEADAVRAVFAWSYRALPPAAARTFRLLGLHPGPHIGTPAAAALTAQPRERTAALLDLLIGAHLLEQTGPHHYQFHDLLRAYAADQAHHEETSDEQHTALTRLASWYLYSAHAAVRAADTFNPPTLDPPTDPTIDPMTFPDYPSALRWHHDEQANLLAIARAASAAGLDQITWQLPVTLHGLHQARHLLDDWLEMATLGLHTAKRLPDRHAQALLHETLGAAHTAAGNLDDAIAHHTAALNLHTDLGDQSGTIEANHSLGLVYLRQRDLPRAQACFKQTLTHARHPSHDNWLAPALCCLAFTHAEAGETEPAAHLAEQSLTELATRTAAATYLRVDPLLVLARLHRETGDLASATTFLDQAATLLQPLEHPALHHAVLLERADLEHARSHHNQALELYWDYLNQQRTIGDRTHQARALDAIGCTLHALGRLDEALEFHRTAIHLNRHPTQSWHLALALTHLADTLTAADQTEQAQTTRTDALTVLAAFTDPRAAALRRHLDNTPTKAPESEPPTSHGEP